MNKNINAENQNGGENPVINQVKRGRKIDPTKLKTITLNLDKTLKKRGAPKVGELLLQVDIQRNIKTSTFNYQTTPFTNEREIVVGERKPRIKKVVQIIEPQIQPENPEPAPVNQGAPVLA